MRYTPLPPDSPPDPPKDPSFKPMQPYDALLILDVEATCFQGTDFDYPNEIIVRTLLPHVTHFSLSLNVANVSTRSSPSA